MFHCRVTPINDRRFVYGESGLFLQILLLGGTFWVLRKNSDYEEGEMDKIEGLLLETEGRYGKLSLWLEFFLIE